MRVPGVLGGAPTEDRLPETQPPPAERRVAASCRHSGRGQSRRASRRTPSSFAGGSGPSRLHSVLRDPTLPCAKDTSVSSAGPFYATVAPLYDPLPRSEWVSWRPASSWQELPPELGEVAKAEEEVAYPRSGSARMVGSRGKMSGGPLGVTVSQEAGPW